MAGHIRYTALLDACVLYPVTVANVLLSLAHTGLFAPKWTIAIEDEWMRNVHAKTGLPVEALTRRRDMMRRAMPDWEIPPVKYSRLMTGLNLPDPNDHHVLAAAIAGPADCIVSFNLKDFPGDHLADFDLKAIHPDEFIIMQMDMDVIAGLTAIKEMRGRFKKPPLSATEFVSLLERNGLFRTADRLGTALELI